MTETFPRKLKIEDVEQAIHQLRKKAYVDIKVVACPWIRSEYSR